jgi:hypothetical protein
MYFLDFSGKMSANELKPHSKSASTRESLHGGNSSIHILRVILTVGQTQGKVSESGVSIGERVLLVSLLSSDESLSLSDHLHDVGLVHFIFVDTHAKQRLLWVRIRSEQMDKAENRVGGSFFGLRPN